ncbi:MAG: nascent polypeptide-associated complex protein [Candidatus Geothermarchaeota archaeon]
MNRELRRALTRAGLSIEEVSDVNYVDIVFKNGRIVRITSPAVMKIKVKDQVAYQITGTESEIETEEVEIKEEDVAFVMQQAGVDRELAIKALQLTGGDIAQAIVIVNKLK